MALNPEKYRSDFPILQNTDVTYFDNACMTLRPRQVIDEVKRYYEECPACGDRSMHRLGKKVDEGVNLTRAVAKKFLGAKKESEIVFTSGTTQSINIIAKSITWRKGDEVLTSNKEHNSNLLPWQKLSALSVKHKILPFDNPQALSDAITKNTRLISLAHTSNMDGSFIDPKPFIKIAHEHDVPVMLDAAQSIPHSDVNVKKLDVDFLACSGHKMLGPTGTGLLYAKEEWLNTLEPQFVGGGNVRDATYESAEYDSSPHKFEAGLQNYAGIFGLKAAMKYLMKIGRSKIFDHEQKLNKKLSEGLSVYDDLSILGPEWKKRSGITSFYMDKVDMHQVSLLLDQSANIATRSGRHCVHSWFNANNIDGTTRASLYFYNTADEIAKFLEAFEQVRGMVK